MTVVLLLSSFNPRTPCGVRQASFRKGSPLLMFQSTHSLRSATVSLRLELVADNVSIHALLAECDIEIGLVRPYGEVSIHALLAECDIMPSAVTPTSCCFNPRTPCGVRPFPCGWSWLQTMFQSTHSLRSATFVHYPYSQDEVVSIHALLAECDDASSRLSSPVPCFNPRTPCGVRPCPECQHSLIVQFQSTHSLRSATLPGMSALPYRAVSIHALLAECDTPV